MRWTSKLAAAALAALLQACATPPVSAPEPIAAAPPRQPVTIIVSIDGFRPDYVSAERTPNLHAAQQDGASGSMRPSFPTMTFPNHYALITGLRPDRNGIVDNNIEDARRPGVRFETKNSAEVRDGFWWDEAEPLWVTAENAGIATATMFWPGSEAEVHGKRPSNWWSYNADISSRQRTDAVLDWLRRPAASRPGFATLYYDVVDKASHNKGMPSPELDEAIADVDAQIGYLRRSLAEMGQPANLVIVSDHGMAPVPPEHEMIAKDEVTDDTLMRAIVAGPMLYLWPLDGKQAAAEARVLRPHPHAECWRKEAIPARFHYGKNPRVAPLVCMAEIGWRFSDYAVDYTKGDHGFDNQDPQMQALFIGVGPAFRRGVALPVFDNVDVYPLLRDLIGLPPAKDIDGSEAVFAPVLTR